MTEEVKRSPRYLEARTLSVALRAAGLDAAVVQSAKNVWYMSGHPRVGSSQRPGGPGAALAVATSDGASVLVAGRWHSGLAAKVSWSDEVVKFRNFAQSGFHSVADVLEAKGLASGTIGIEMNYISENDFLHLSGALPDASFVDLGTVIDDLRVRKSAQELEQSAVAYEKLASAVMAGISNAKVGESRLAIHNRVMRQILEAGTDTGRGGTGAPCETIVPLVSTSDQITSNGDVLVLDYTCSFGAYAARVCRTVTVGASDASIADRYARQHDALMASVAEMAPGLAAAEAARRVHQLFAAAGTPCTSAVVGHGLALGFEDGPVLAANSDDILEPGMEFVLVPRVQGGLMVSRRVVVSEGGALSFDDGYQTASLMSIG